MSLDSVRELREAISQLPKIDVADRLGFTGYIDFLSHDELTAPAVAGVDSLGRQFVFFSGEISVNGFTTRFVQTFFQRYPDCDIWMACGSTEYPQLMTTTGGASEIQINLVTELVKNGVYSASGEFMDLSELRLLPLLSLTRSGVTCPIDVVIKLSILPLV